MTISNRENNISKSESSVGCTHTTPVRWSTHQFSRLSIFRMNNASFLRKLVFCEKKKKERKKKKNVMSQLRHFLVVHPLLRKIMVNSSWSNVSHGCQVLYALNIIFVCSDRRTDLINHLLTLFSYVFVSHLLQVGCVLPQMLWLPPTQPISICCGHLQLLPNNNNSTTGHSEIHLGLIITSLIISN